MFLPTPSHLQRLRDISREKSAEMTRMYSQMSHLGQLNAECNNPVLIVLANPELIH